jgi:hypothetical protein
MLRAFKHTHRSATVTLAFVCALLVCAAATARAQQPDALVPPQPAPPPMLYVPEALRAELGAARDAKARTRLAIEAADARMAEAERLTAAQQYDAAAAALGVYQAVVADALTFLRQSGRNDGKTRDLLKMLEQAVFKHTGRLEAMRRNTPPDYAGNVRAALNHARELRTAALNAFYGNTVLHDEPPGKTKTPPDPAQQNKPPAPLPEHR